MKRKESSKGINPALKITNFAKFAKIVFDELNHVRRDPVSYSKKVQKWIEDFDENESALNINGCGMFISEGKEVFHEAVEFLKKVTPLSGLTYSLGIGKGADELLNLLILHDGIPEMSRMEKSYYDLEKRTNLYGEAYGELDELIDYGTFDPSYVILNFILCDGDKKRKERSIIFNPNVKYCGLSSGLLPSERVCTVINFTEYFFNPGETIPQSIIDKFSNSTYNNTITSYKKETMPFSPIPYNTTTDYLTPNETPVRRKNSANNYKEKENRYKDYIIFENNPNTQSYQESGSKFFDKNTLYSNTNTSQHPLTNHSSIYQNSTIKSMPSVEATELPEGVERIKFTEKLVKNKSTNQNEIIVKKVTFYIDGRTDTVLYKK